MMQKDQMRKHIPKIALLGLILESNRFARPASLDDFERLTVKRGKVLIDDASLWFVEGECEEISKLKSSLLR